MKQGDLVRFKNETFVSNECWLVLRIKKPKKVWHREIILFDGRGVIKIPWDHRLSYEVINEEG